MVGFAPCDRGPIGGLPLHSPVLLDCRLRYLGKQCHFLDVLLHLRHHYQHLPLQLADG